MLIAAALCGCSGAGSSDLVNMSDAVNQGGTSSLVNGGSTSTGGSGAAGQATATSSNASSGGSTTANSGATGGASSTSRSFDWGTSTYNANGGVNVSHQTHDNGLACLASCHAHTFQTGGTAYAANGTTAAANVQFGVRINGTLYTDYSGSGGNFFMSIPGTLDWASAQVAMRNANGTTVHPTTSGMSGNCNASNCHGTSNRITQP
jgi:hypothetical protein